VPGRETPLASRELHMVSYPSGEVRASDFRVVETRVRAPQPGQVLVRNTWTSVDAALRIRMRERTPAGYFPAFPLDAPLDGIMTVGEVVESRAEDFSPGDTVWHAHGWRDYAVVQAGKEELRGVGTLRRLDVTAAPPQTYLGVLGPAGLTAYAGLFRIANVREGDVIWVSAAAGSVGSLASQFARIRGHRVIGSAGSNEKVAYLLDELGLDAAFNYKSGTVVELLREAAPDGIDVYFDNVGGEHLEAALTLLRQNGRVAMCGQISEYEITGDARTGPSNIFLCVAKDLTIRGFRASSWPHLIPEMQREVAGWIREGRLKYEETIVDGLERAPEALAMLMRGDTIGKTVVRIA
jgi:NADPH-dependent curcumin reductase CurA